MNYLKKTLQFETYVYGMYFDKNEFMIENTRFQRLEKCWSEYEQLKYGSPFNPSQRLGTDKMTGEVSWQNRHYPTGLVTVTWLDFEETLREAIDKTVEVLRDHSMLLSFAHGHHVPFGPDMHCYEVNGANRQDVATERIMTRFGKPGIEPITLLRSGIEPFLRHCIPLFRDTEFVNRTQIKRGIMWYNDVECIEDPVFETHYSFLWTALEILAGAYATETNNLKLESADRISEIRQSFEQALRYLDVRQPKAWVAKITDWTSILNRSRKLLNKYSLDKYAEYLSDLYGLRNQIVHGSPVEITQADHKRRFRLCRIIEKLTLKILGFYDRKDCIRSAIMNEDLLAI